MSTEVHLLITGANGFVGSALCAEAVARGYVVVGAVRSPAQVVKKCAYVSIGTIDQDTNWRPALVGVNMVVHLAARVHVMADASADPLQAFRQVNVMATLHLARQAAAAGVQRFVFISSVKVNGEESAPGRPFAADDTPEPQDPYGVSKMEAEQGLREIAADTGMAVVIIRPPLVYGPGVKANFFSMMQWLSRGVPLPLGAIDNRRSLVALDNLVDLILLCCHHPAAVNQTFMVSDDEDLSTTALLRRMGQALGRPARLVPLPPSWLLAAAALVGKAGVANRLCGSLQVDIAKTQRLLGWVPPITVDEGLLRAVRGSNLGTRQAALLNAKVTTRDQQSS